MKGIFLQGESVPNIGGQYLQAGKQAMLSNRKWTKMVVIALMIGAILSLHYFTFHGMKYHHAVYRMLFYVPLVMGSFWFGLKGVIYIGASVSLFYLPYVVIQWQGLSFEDFDRLLEGGLYFVMAFILGSLVEKERKKRTALVQAESLAAVGRAVSEVVHDMKTPLMAIGGFVNQVSRKLREDDPNQKKLEVVIQETARLESMVQGMLEFGKPLELQRSNTDLNELVQKTVEVAKPKARRCSIELKTDLESSLPSLMLDTSRVKQVLLNLVTNAIQASPAGERVLVTTRLVNSGVSLTISDRGCGISERNRESVFHPFFTTKKRGTGLGLGIVKKIVEAHEGEVFFHPNPEKGVTFSVLFPIL